MTILPLTRSRRSTTEARARGLTVVECLLAAAIVAIAGGAIAYVLSAGRARFSYADQVVRGVRVAEHLIDEVAAKAYAGSGGSRPAWCIDDYDGYEDGPDGPTDLWGDHYGPADSVFRRSVEVSGGSVDVPSLDGTSITGKFVTVRVEAPDGGVEELPRFVRRPFP